MSFRREVGFGLFWVAISTIGAKGLSFFHKLILARLLVPADFGLVAYATLAIGILELFKELGFGAALIYRRDKIEQAANTTFWAIISSSCLLYVLAWVLAPLAAAFFKADATLLVPILRALALILVISSIGQVPLTLMARGMGFKNKVIPEMVAIFVGSLVSVILALLGRGVWSLVYGQLITAALLSVLVWFFCSWRPALAFDWDVARELWDYGKHIIGTQVMVFFITNVDDAFVGRFLGSAALGIYGFAYDMSNLPATHLSRIVGQVLFPAFSKVQGNLDRLRQVFFQSVKYVSLIAFPVSAVTMVFARDFILVAFGGKWEAAIVPLRWLTVYGLARAIAVNMGNVFKAGGKPKWLFRIATVRLVVMAGLLYPAIIWRGTTGVAALSAGVAIIDFALSLIVTNRILRAPWMRYFGILVPMSLASFSTAWLAHPFYVWIAKTIHPFVSLPLAGGLAVLVYLAIMYAYDGDIRRMASRVIEGGLAACRRWRIAHQTTQI